MDMRCRVAATQSVRKTRRRKIEAVYGILEAHHRAMQLPSTLIINEVSHPDEEIE